MYDLLNEGSKTLTVRHDAEQDQFFVPGLVEVECSGLDDVLAVATEGAAARHRAAHDLNRDSSRGHAIMTLKILRAAGAPLPPEATTARRHATQGASPSVYL